MVKNSLDGQTLNPTIQAASNYIGQKLFAYVSHGKNINDRIRQKFAKSLIFIGDEGQIYNPLTNTYVGIGQTAYTNAVTYIEEAHEKIDALNKMLTSSMVTSIYANWGEDTWRDMTYIAEASIKDGKPDVEGLVSAEALAALKPGLINRDYNFSDVLPSKVFATNDIILRGIGDYDPQTKLAYTKELVHITDKNIDGTPDEIAQKTKALEGSYIEVQSQKAFATSGITVSLEKGYNRYMFTYTFNHPTCIPGANPSIWTDQDSEKTLDGKRATNYTKKVTFYYTKEELASFLAEYDGTGKQEYTIPGTEISWAATNPRKDISSGASEDIKEPMKAFIAGMTPVWDDEISNIVSTDKDETGKPVYKVKLDDKTETTFTIWKEFWSEPIVINHQLFKQGKNVMTIDDKLTWSYISSAYSYALDFSKEYTDTQVERIYRDLLGQSSTLLIPVGLEQVKVQKFNPEATKDLDFFSVTWDDKANKWVTSIKNDSVDSDQLKDSSSKLTKYVLNEGSIYVQEHSISTEVAETLYSNKINSDVEINGKTCKVLPWFVLTDLAKDAEKYVDDYNQCYALNPEILYASSSDDKYVTLNTYFWNIPAEGAYYITNGTSVFPYRGEDDYTYMITDALSNTKSIWHYTIEKPTGIIGEPETGDLTFTTLKTENNTMPDWNNIMFMNFERDTNYDDDFKEDEWKDGDDFSRPSDTTLEGNENDLSFADKDPNKNPSNGQWGLPAGTFGEWGQTHKHKYFGSIYSDTRLYSIIDNLNDIPERDENKPINETNNQKLFVVNTKWTSLSDVNLSDGIQTLKEVTYILDIITDGWGNHYEDAEGNGILLTYTIANNHDRIVDHEKRLQKLEKGENIVKGIGRLDHMMSKFVDLQLTSDILWKFLNITDGGTPNETFKYIGDADHTDGLTFNWTLNDAEMHYNPADKAAINQTSSTIFGIPETYGFLGVVPNAGRYHENIHGEESEPTFISSTENPAYTYTLQQIPVSYIISYNAHVRNWLRDKANKERLGIAIDADETAPSFSTYFSEYSTIGKLEVVNWVPKEKNESGINSTYIFTSPEGRFAAVHSYVGHVGVGIDLKLAQTYTTTTNLHDNNGSQTGFICVDAHSPFIIKKVEVTSILPQEIILNADVLRSDIESPADINNSGKRYPDGCEITKLNDLTLDDQNRLTKDLEDMGVELTDVTFVSTETVPDAPDGAIFKYKFVIDVNAAIDTDAAIKPQDALMTEAVFDGKIYMDAADIALLKSDDEDDANVAAGIYSTATAIGEKQEVKPANTVITFSTEKNYKFFVKYTKHSQVTAVDLEYDGLTTTNWVATYVAATVDNVTTQLKAVEFEAYRFSENLLKNLDGNYVAPRGQVVIGIEQTNGLVTPVLGDLPKDELMASYSVWGENTGVIRNYTVVTTEQVEQEELHGVHGDVKNDGSIVCTIDNDFPLYVAPADQFTYILCTPENIPESTADGKFGFDDDGNIINATDEWKTKWDVVDTIGYYKDATGQFKKLNLDYFKAFTGENTHVGEIQSSSWKIGPKYALYVETYLKVQRYVRIDGAKLVKGVTDTAFTITIDGKVYKTQTGTTAPGKNEAILTTSVEANHSNHERKYLSATYDYSDNTYAGDGKTTMKVTAHITKLADAAEDNSGLVDAYDVKSTLDSMFEWVDLSRWDLDEDAATVNPMNTKARENGGYYTMDYRIANAKSVDASASIYPLPIFSDKEYAGKVELPEELKAAIAAGDADDPNA